MRLEIIGLKKTYGEHKALNGVSFQLEEGVYGLLGPNGAGKSTLMNCIVDNLQWDDGDILFEGVSIKKLGKEYKRLLGFMAQQQTLYDSFTGYQFLDYIAALKGVSKKTVKSEIESVLQLVNLHTVKDKKIREYSGGMKQRILIAQTVLGDAKIIVLDEPTAGLDPKERIRIRELLARIAQNKIVLIATHVISDVDRISKELILIRKGEIIQKNTPENLLEELKQRRPENKEFNLEEVYMHYFSEK